MNVTVDHIEDGIQTYKWAGRKMPRWVSQTDDFRCGPIGIINALKWAGIKISWGGNCKTLTDLTKCTWPDGAQPDDINRALRTLGAPAFTVRYRNGAPKLPMVRAAIKSGCAILIGFQWPWAGGHYALLVDIVWVEGVEYFGLINLTYLGHSAFEYIQGKTFRRMCLSRRKNQNYWLLTKRT